jgi:hypothetical protein
MVCLMVSFGLEFRGQQTSSPTLLNWKLKTKKWTPTDSHGHSRICISPIKQCLRRQMLWKTDNNGWGTQKVCLMNFGLELNKYSVQPFLIVFEESQEMSSNWLSLTHNRLFLIASRQKLALSGPDMFRSITAAYQITCWQCHDWSDAVQSCWWIGSNQARNAFIRCLIKRRKKFYQYNCWYV